MKRTILAAATFSLALVAHADFKDGNKLYSQSQVWGSTDWSIAIGYVTGVHDTVSDVLVCAPSNATAGQMLDMVRNYMTQFPDQRDRMASGIVLEVLQARWPCKKQPPKGTTLSELTVNTKALRKVRRLFNSPNVPQAHNRSYQRQWVRQIRALGDNWLLAKPQEHVNNR